MNEDLQAYLGGEEIRFLETDSFLTYLRSSIANRGVSTASIFAINAMLVARSIVDGLTNCNPEDLIPLLARLARGMLGSSGMVFRVGPGLLVCIHLAPHPVDPELIGWQVERSLRRVFGIPARIQDILKGTVSYHPSATASENAVRHFLSKL